jgi:hypothetical protein
MHLVANAQRDHHPIYGIAASSIICPSCDGEMILLPYGGLCLNESCAYILPPTSAKKGPSMPRVRELVQEAHQPELPLTYPLLVAWKAFQDAQNREQAVGEEFAIAKRQYNTLKDPMKLARVQQATAADEETVAQYQTGLRTREISIAEAEAYLVTLHERRGEANAVMLKARDAWIGLKERARAAIRNHRNASHASETDPSAMERYKSRQIMAVSFQVLQSLVGPDETVNILHHSARPAWLTGERV